MIDKETYKHELIRMWDSLRTENKGECSCDGVPCVKCPLIFHIGCTEAQNIFDIYNTVKKWSDEHPPKKYKVSRLEYDTLKSCIERLLYGKFFDNELLMSLLEKGYFKGATSKTYVEEYFNNCEVEDDN